MNTSQKMVEQFVRNRGWEKQWPDQVAKSISIEAAELFEIFQWSSPAAAEIKRNSKSLAEIRGELADVLIYSLQMANLLGFDVDLIVKQKLAFADKKYPAELMNKRLAGESEADKHYWKTKNAYRDKR